MLLATPFACQAQTIPQTTGIFAINPIYPSGAIYSSILTDQYVKGIFATFGWNSIEATEGVYNWTLIDGVLSQAASNGKLVTLGVTAGWETPSWVYADGAQSFNFLWASASFGPALCSVQSIPIPWDPVFLAKWQTFVEALGVRYSSNATLVSVMLYGLNYQAVETSLPITNGASIGSGATSCTGYNYPLLWQKAGYTRTKVENALFSMQSDFQSAFPGTQLMAALNPDGFPPIDQNGSLILNWTADSQVPIDLLATGSSILGAQFSAGNGGLNAVGWTYPLLMQYAGTIDTGYQTVGALGSALPTAINSALGAGARWLQLYPPDITSSANQSAIISASQELH
jgi:hypothetical protein